MYFYLIYSCNVYICPTNRIKTISNKSDSVTELPDVFGKSTKRNKSY